jgi:hypothetical protein
VFDNTHVVLLVGENELEQVVPVKHPPVGATEGTWLNITRNNTGALADIEIDQRATKEIKTHIASKLDRLRRRGRKLGGSNGGDSPPG